MIPFKPNFVVSTGVHGKWPKTMAGGEQSFDQRRVPQTSAKPQGTTLGSYP